MIAIVLLFYVWVHLRTLTVETTDGVAIFVHNCDEITWP